MNVKSLSDKYVSIYPFKIGNTSQAFLFSEHNSYVNCNEMTNCDIRKEKMTLVEH